MARRRFREALDVLNEAIRTDPRHAESYDNRAQVFDALGMSPQAEADRRKVEELGGVRRPLPEESETTETAKPQAKQRQRPAQLGMRYPAQPRARSGSGPALRAMGTLLITIGLFVAAGIGIYLALTTLSDAVNGGDDTAAAGSPTPNGSESPGASSTTTGTPTPIPESVEQALNGAPLSFPAVRSAWEGKGLTVSVGNVSSEVAGFKTTAADVTLTKGAATIKVAVLFYDSPEQLASDWAIGDTVTPKTGHTPGGPSPWANKNSVVVMLEDDDAIHADARDAFLQIP
jgi:hypothetical protein